jgi:hypothetical protein
MSDTAFEKWEAKQDGLSVEEVCLMLRDLGGVPGAALRGRLTAWQAAEAYLREPQTAETCQAVPPHPRGCLIEEGWEHWEVNASGVGTIPYCLTCEAEKQTCDAQAKVEKLERVQTPAKRLAVALVPLWKDWMADKYDDFPLWKYEGGILTVGNLRDAREIQALAACEEVKP